MKTSALDWNESDILITTGGSEALQIAANCLLDDGDEVIVPEPFYPNYHTFITTAGGVIHPLHTKPEEGYFYADRARIEACITPKTKAIMITNPGNPTGTCLTEEQMKMLLDVAVDMTCIWWPTRSTASLPTTASRCIRSANSTTDRKT